MTHPIRLMIPGLLLGLVACNGDPTTDTTDPYVTPTVTETVPCVTPPDIANPPLAIEPYQLYQFQARGGTGAYSWRLEKGGSGGTVSDDGAYVAGATPAVDAIVLSDAGCDTEDRVEFEVVAPLAIVPDHVSAAGSTAIQFDVVEGAGPARCSLHINGTGASVSADCSYVAGSQPGRDVVRATDTSTGSFVDATVDVMPDFQLRVEGEGRIFVPVGSKAVPVGATGSGVLDLTVLSGTLRVEGRTMVASNPGRSIVRATDHYTGDTANLVVEAVSAQSPTLPRDGLRTGAGTVLGLGDVNGDGYEDVALGHPEVAIGGASSGAVFVYAGGPDGLDPTPVQQMAGPAANEDWGRDLWRGDLNNDGRLDLVVAADRTDRGGINTGSIRIYEATHDGFFESEPWVQYHGEQQYGRMGSSITVCDFDGNGWPDLASGARDVVDPEAPGTIRDQGGVYIWIGTKVGFGDAPDFALFGVVPDGHGGWSPAQEQHFGMALASGDFDGDGLCDLAVGAPEGGLSSANEDGVVQVYYGTLDQGLVLERTPRLTFTGNDSELGRRMAAGDIDNDGKDDLLLANWRDDTVDKDAGLVGLYLGSRLPSSVTTTLTPEDADWRVYGNETNAHLGASVAIADATGDGRLDVLVGMYRGRAPGGRFSSGSVRVYDGVQVASDAAARTDASGQTPWFEAGGDTSYDRMGQAVGAADVNGDGSPDLVGLAGHDDAWGIDVGAPYWTPTDSAAWSRLELPGVAAGSEVGDGLALFDVDGDGCDDALYGIPGAGTDSEGANAGRVYARTCTGTQLGPLFGGFPTHSVSDAFGQLIEPVGDFDNDGYDDLAIVARKDSNPSTFGSEFVDGAACEGSRFQTGSVMVFRGGPTGVATEPSFIAFGATSAGFIWALTGGFDHNGDGYDDVAIGGLAWGNNEMGGYTILHGRPATAGKVTVMCGQRVQYGFRRYDRMGDNLAGAGDIDGDGCDELAVGAPREELHSDYFNQGVLRILWGHGGAGCPASAEVTTLSFRNVGRELGSGLDAGKDVDGDGIPDIVAGGDANRVDFSEVGGAWLVPGSHVVTLPRQSASGGFPTAQDTDWHYPLPGTGLDAPYAMPGWQAGSLFGTAIALLPDPTQPGQQLIAVGTPFGSQGGTPWSGGVRVYRWVDGGIDPVPWAVVMGESDSPFGELGHNLAGGAQAAVPTLLVGAPRSSRGGLEQGAAYVLRFEEVGP